ncbi:hypothetical protein AYI69_g8089 [Smittium culicis]|uniref:Uncharacterized protein n=1 Tax=Smittium culicis TaxID=133412 RepID=A0A1R1XMA4_9FUNG|nr:hypothetical protein AYI69_g8089 [Smittium culicis]
MDQPKDDGQSPQDGIRYIEKWVQNPIHAATIPYSKEELQSFKDSPAYYQLDYPEIFRLNGHQNSLEYKPNLCLAYIWEGRAGKDTLALGYDTYKIILHKEKFKDKRYQAPERHDIIWSFYLKAGYKISISPCYF